MTLKKTRQLTCVMQSEDSPDSSIDSVIHHFTCLKEAFSLPKPRRAIRTSFSS